MKNKEKLCSSTVHEEEVYAKSFCRKCEIYMCQQCEGLHTKLFSKHQIFMLENSSDEIFTGFCPEKRHHLDLEFFCKNHNQLCCAACISKIKKNTFGNHKDCSICLIEEIKDEKLNKLKENINHLENISKNIEKSIEEIKLISEKINEKKDELKEKIQKMFTKIRNELNNREDEILLEIDKKYDEIYFNEEISKNCEKLPNKIKSSLDKGNKLTKEIKDINLNLLINECINIENNIKDINSINEKIKKYNSPYNFKFSFNIENKEEMNMLIRTIKSFGKRPIKIQNYKLEKSIKMNSGICSLIILSNHDIAIGKRDGELVIFDSKNLKEIVKVRAHSEGNTSIYSLLELSDKTIITCGGCKTMKNYIYNPNEKKLIEIQELFCRENSGYICRVVELSNKNIVSSDNTHILVWKKTNNNKFEIIKDISDFGGVMQHLFLMKDNYIICHNNQGVLRIYNSLEEFKLEKEIKNIISNDYMHRFCLINSDIFCLAGDYNIYLFSIVKKELINTKKVDKMKFHSIITLPNNTILGGAYENESLCHLLQFEIDENYQMNEISRIEKIHSTIIWQLAYLNYKENCDEIISVSDDYYLKVWELH